MSCEDVTIIVEETAENIEFQCTETVENVTVIVSDSEGVSKHSELTLDDGTNPHGTTKTDVGLGSVPNLDTTNAVNDAHTHENKTILDQITEAFTTSLKTTYDNAVSSLNVLLSTGQRLINSTEIIKLSNTSGTNTGDQDLSGLMVKSNNLSDVQSVSNARNNLGLGTLATQNGTFSGSSSGTNTGDETTLSIQTKRPIKTIYGVSIEGTGDIQVESILQNLGGFTKFSTGSSSAYPFIGSVINGGTVTAWYNSSPKFPEKYANGYNIMGTGASGSNRGYRYRDGIDTVPVVTKGLTFFAIILPYSDVDVITRIGFMHTGFFTSNVENSNGRFWINIINGQLQAKVSESGLYSTGTQIAITNRQWLMVMIEVEEFVATNSPLNKVRFKVKKTDGTVIYNEVITANIGTGGQTGVGLITTKGTATSNEYLLGVSAMGWWQEKPNFLKDF